MTIGIVTLASVDPATPSSSGATSSASRPRPTGSRSTTSTAAPVQSATPRAPAKPRWTWSSPARWPRSRTSSSTRPRTLTSVSWTASTPQPARTSPTRSHRAGASPRLHPGRGRQRRSSHRLTRSASTMRSSSWPRRVRALRLGGRLRRLHRRRGYRHDEPVGREPGQQPVDHGRRAAPRCPAPSRSPRPTRQRSARRADLGLGLAVAALRGLRRPAASRSPRAPSRTRASAAAAASARSSRRPATSRASDAHQFSATEYLTPTDLELVTLDSTLPTRVDLQRQARRSSPAPAPAGPPRRVSQRRPVHRLPGVLHLRHSPAQPLEVGWGGTSFVAPQFNGSTAVIDSLLGHRVGFWNPPSTSSRSSHSPFTPLTPPSNGNTNLFYTGTPATSSTWAPAWAPRT